MRQWAILIMVFGAGVLTTAAATRNPALAIGAIGLVVIGAGDRSNYRVRMRPAQGYLVADYRWWPTRPGVAIQLFGLALIVVAAWRLAAM